MTNCKSILRKYYTNVCSGRIWLRIGVVASCSELSDDCSGSIEDEEFLDRRSDSEHVKASVSLIMLTVKNCI